jgi:holo-[acyl-carrier protein] synthase
MIFGIGFDNFEVCRIKAAIEKDTGFLNDIFTDDEIAYCEKLNSKHQNYAARFSAKEAFMKALGTGWRYGIRFTDISVFNDELGKPNILLSGKAKELVLQNGISNVHVTLSHSKSMAIALVILEKGELEKLHSFINNQNNINISTT